jgi:uncharacterized protein YsxB (DUF464 family)
MITIEKRENQIIVTGHALYNPGNDIVCAAISAFTYNLYNSINLLTWNYASVDDDNNTLVLTFKDAEDYDTNLLVQSYILGCKAVAKEYPDHVKVCIEN